jgi:hypothetical protein
MVINSLKKNIKKLKTNLNSHDSDEGIKIQQENAPIKLFVNKRSSGAYVMEIVNKTSSNSETKREDIRFFQSLDQLIEFINKIFGKSYSVTEYYNVPQ